MRVSFLGAARTVTGSQHMIEVNGRRLLLDCGLYQGKGKEAFEFNSKFDFDPRQLEAVILSHAHIDHSGNLPGLVKAGYVGPIYATPVTAHLCDIMLRDSAHIQESQAEGNGDAGHTGGGKGRKGQPAEPLYTMKDAEQVFQYFQPIPYEVEFEPLPGVTAKLINAGHILGSAAVRLELRENGGKAHRLWFSGDIGRCNLPLIQDPVLPYEVDTLISECTYGDTIHEDPLAAREALAEVLKRTLERGGKVVVPAFAVGRTQELVYDVHQLIESGDLPPVKVFVDSPLAVEASKIFREHEELFDDEAKNFMREAKNREALGFDLLSYVESVEDSRALMKLDEPMVIISASGMLETGRVVHHVRNTIEDPRNTILIVSYQAENTLGRELLNGAQQVEIWGDVFEVKAEVERVSGLSAHAGQRMLVEYAQAVKGTVENIFLVHGEQGAAEALREKLQEKGLERIFYPYLRQGMELG